MVPRGGLGFSLLLADALVAVIVRYPFVVLAVGNLHRLIRIGRTRLSEPRPSASGDRRPRTLRHGLRPVAGRYRLYDAIALRFELFEQGRQRQGGSRMDIVQQKHATMVVRLDAADRLAHDLPGGDAPEPVVGNLVGAPDRQRL